MPPAPTSPHEARRLAAVHKLRLLGTPAEERFDRITRLARQLFGVPMACLDIVGEKLAWLKSVQGFDAIEGARKDSYCHYAVLKDGVCLVENAHDDPRVFDSAFADSWTFYAGVPLHFDGERVGVLCVGDSRPRPFTPADFATLIDLALLAERELEIAALSEAQMQLAVDNVELEMKSRIDVLTHLWNRGAIFEIASAEAAQTRSSTAILLIDLDHFKAINDNHGHAAGDEVLRVVSSRLRSAVRNSDAVGRYGGEEFLAVLPGVTIMTVAQIAERIRTTICSEPILFEGRTIHVSTSIGCACTNPRSEDTIDTLIDRADRALYRAKDTGRNRVEGTLHEALLSLSFHPESNHFERVN